MNHYQQKINYEGSSELAFDAIAKEMSKWWTKMSGQFLSIGDKAKTDFGMESYWVFEAVTLDSPHLIELKCCEANHIHSDGSVDMKEEWLNSVLKFEISNDGKISEVLFTHIGLHPELKCYDVCKAGWDHYFLKSLKDFLSGGKAVPGSY